MNVLLIRPKPDKETIGLQHVMVCEPLELEYLAANMEQTDANIEILDMILEKKPLEYFMEKYKPDVVGMSGYITHVNVIKDYACRIKRVIPHCRIVVGGVYAEVVPEDFISIHIDFIVEANGPITFNAVLKHLDKKEQSIEKNIEKSITDIDIQGTYKPGRRSLKDTSFLYLFPDRQKVERYRHKYYYMFHNPCALVKTAYGCPYNCSFCFCKEITDGKYFTRTIDSVIEELKEIPEPEIYIVDDDFLFSRERILEFCHKLAENKINKKFLVYGRTDFVSKNEDVIKTFRDHGLRAVIVGLESFKNEDLDKYNKMTSIYENEAAISILKKYDIEVYGTLILGMDFSKEDFVHLYQWLKKIDITFVNLQPLTPLYGTGIFQEYEKDLVIAREEFEKWDLAHLVLKPQKMSVRRYYFEMVKLYYKITMRPKNILRLIRKYGLSEVLKLSIGSSAVTIQYMQKILRGKSR
ncbi:MAG: radical SAM protein [Desulfitibacter sp. BRH_c19]|nr:MAG: radical SAM protein [Desulfitibacter sp. BRH_c19]